MGKAFQHVLIIADIEGSSGCWSYSASAFMTDQWPEACLGMSRDADAVAAALQEAGVGRVTVKDFHRTGYNLLPERFRSGARVVHGFRQGPVPGMGTPGDADAIMFLGMHAASGTGGFLAHTLTSRIGRLTANNTPLPEVVLFSSALSGYGLPPLFFSGCPVACAQAGRDIPGIATFPIDKSSGFERFDARRWRRELAAAAVLSLDNPLAEPYNPEGPFAVVATMRDGPAASRKIADRWGLAWNGADILFDASDMQALYLTLIRICYLTPLTERIMPLALPLSNARGFLGLKWVRHRLGRKGI